MLSNWSCKSTAWKTNEFLFWNPGKNTHKQSMEYSAVAICLQLVLVYAIAHMQTDCISINLFCELKIYHCMAKAKEINHCLAIDASIRSCYDASAFCALNLAELHMDVIIHAVGGWVQNVCNCLARLDFNTIYWLLGLFHIFIPTVVTYRSRVSLVATPAKDWCVSSSAMIKKPAFMCGWWSQPASEAYAAHF